MTKTTKGTPRKRPYDVKRKLERAINRAVDSGVELANFFDLVVGETYQPREGRTCAVGCYLVGRRPKTGNIVADAAEGLGLDPGDVWGIIKGFDGPLASYIHSDDERWVKVGAELRREFLGA